MLLLLLLNVLALVQVAALASEAAAGQRPWVSPELLALMAGDGSGSRGASSKRLDSAAFRLCLAQRFSAKGCIYDNCSMYSQDGQLLCHTGARVGLRGGSGSGGEMWRRFRCHCRCWLAGAALATLQDVSPNAPSCIADRKKLEWYVKKGLAVVVETEPALVVRLTFKHKTGDQQAGTSGACGGGVRVGGWGACVRAGLH